MFATRIAAPKKDRLVIILPNENVGTPVRKAPVVHPPPIFAPRPKRRPPVKTTRIYYS